MHIKLEKNVCRVCLQNSGEIPLFSGQGGETPFEMIRLAFKIEVVKDTNLPNTVCITCLENIKNALKTSETIIDSEMHLSIYMETNNSSSAGEQASKFQTNNEGTVSSGAPEPAFPELQCIKSENFDDSSLDLEDNLTSKTEPPTNINFPPKYECEICGAKLDTVKGLGSHKRIHLGTPKTDYQGGALNDSPDIIPNDETGKNEELDAKHVSPHLLDSNSIPPPKRPPSVTDQLSPLLKKHKLSSAELEGCSIETSVQSSSTASKTVYSTGTQTDAKNIDNSYVIEIVQQKSYDTELFESDEEANSDNFLCEDINMPYITSTQAEPSNRMQSEINSVNASIPEPTINDVMNTLNSQGNMIRLLVSEVKLLRRELRGHDDNKTNHSKDIIKLPIPATSPLEFEQLENEIKRDKLKEKILINRFENIDDQNLNRYIRGCLRIILTDEAACSFSWFGRHENISVESFHVMSLIIESATKKFPSSNTANFVFIIKRWFNYAKDRVRKCKK